MSQSPYKCAGCGLINPPTAAACRRCGAAPGTTSTPELDSDLESEPWTTRGNRRALGAVMATLGSLLLAVSTSEALDGEPFYPKFLILVSVGVGLGLAALVDPDVLLGPKQQRASSGLLAGAAVLVFGIGGLLLAILLEHG